MVELGNIFHLKDNDYILIWDRKEDDQGYDCVFVINFSIHRDYSNYDQDTKLADLPYYAEFDNVNKVKVYSFIEYYSAEPATLNGKQVKAIGEMLKGLHFNMKHFKSILKNKVITDS